MLLLFTLQVAAAAHTRPCTSRRAVVSAVLCCLSLALPSASRASDFQTAESAAASQFVAAEAARASREQAPFQGRRAFELKVSAVQDAWTADEFVAASDALALEVIRLQVIPEGVLLQAAVGRLRAAYGLMPTVEYACDGRRACFSRGAEVEAAYAALLRELRRYAQKASYAQSGGSELPNTPFSF